MPAVPCATPRSTVYHRRPPERTLLYRTVQAHGDLADTAG